MRQLPPGWALVTGSTTPTGIGFSTAQELAKLGQDIILVGSGRKDLRVGQGLANDLRRDFGVRAACLFENLAIDGAAERLIVKAEEAASDSGYPIRGLVNAAGFALKGTFLDASGEENGDMMQVHMNNAAKLMHHFGKRMKELGGGYILTVSSLLAITPSPYNALYGATKAFEASLSQAVSFEEGPDILVCVAKCGAMKSEMMNDYSTVLFRYLPFLVKDTQPVGRIMVKGMLNGRRVVVPGASSKALASLEILPKKWTAGIASVLMRSIGENDHPKLEAIRRFYPKHWKP